MAAGGLHWRGTPPKNSAERPRSGSLPRGALPRNRGTPRSSNELSWTSQRCCLPWSRPRCGLRHRERRPWPQPQQQLLPPLPGWPWGWPLLRQRPAPTREQPQEPPPEKEGLQLPWQPCARTPHRAPASAQKPRWPPAKQALRQPGQLQGLPPPLALVSASKQPQLPPPAREQRPPKLPPRQRPEKQRRLLRSLSAGRGSQGRRLWTMKRCPPRRSCGIQARGCWASGSSSRSLRPQMTLLASAREPARGWMEPSCHPDG